MFRREFLNRLPAVDNYSLEPRRLTQLARDGQLSVFKHSEFWQCMLWKVERRDLRSSTSRGSNRRLPR